MTHHTTRPLGTVTPLRRTTTVEGTSRTLTTAHVTTTTPSPAPGVRQRVGRLFRRRRPREDSYRPRPQDVQPFDQPSVDWRRMLMSVQRLG
jgi:hypothetical protein